MFLVMKMKKIVVMSDSHGYHQMIDRVKELEPDGDRKSTRLNSSHP